MRTYAITKGTFIRDGRKYREGEMIELDLTPEIEKLWIRQGRIALPGDIYRAQRTKGDKASDALGRALGR